MANGLQFGNKVVFVSGLPFTLPIATVDPGSGTAGDMYYNSTSNTVRYYNGSAWAPIAAQLSGLPLNDNDIIVGGASNNSEAVSTSSVGNILADSSTGLTIKNAAIVNAMVSSSAAISLSKLAATGGTINGVLYSDSLGHIANSSILYTNLFLADGSVPATSNLNIGLNRITDLADGFAATDAATYGQVILANGFNTFTANQSMGGFKLTSLADGSSSTDAVNYGQLTSLSLGLIWQGPIHDPDLVDDSLSTPPGSPVFSLLYIIAGSATGAWTGLEGHAVWWDGAQWIDLSTGNLAASGFGTPVQVGARFLVAAATFYGPAHVGGTFAGGTYNDQIATVTGNTPGSFTYAFTFPLNNWAVSDLFAGSQHANNSFVYATFAPYTFAITAANATAGAVYTNNTFSFTVTTTIVGGTSLLTTGDGVPTPSGTLTKFSGTGDATITFSSYTGSNWINFAGPSKNAAGAALAYNGNTLNVLFDNVTLDLTSNQLEIKNNGVTNAKLATMVANTVKANITGGSAAPTDVPFVSTNTVSSGVFRDSSGNFATNQITANAFISGGATPASAGTIRLPTNTNISWRNSTNTGNHSIVSKDFGFGFDGFAFLDESDSPNGAILLDNIASPDNRGFIFAGEHASGNRLPLAININGNPPANSNFTVWNDWNLSQIGFSTLAFSSDTNADLFFFGKARGTGASPTIVSSGDTLGAVVGAGYDGGNYQYAARIAFTVNNTPSTGVMPGSIIFQTTPDGSNTPQTALAINRNKQHIFQGTQVLGSSSILVNPAPLTGGTSTTTKPLVKIGNAGTDNNWSTSGTTFGINPATGFTGNLIDAQVNAVAKFKVDASGNETLAGSLFMGVSPNLAELMPLATFTIADNQSSPATIFSMASASHSVLIVEYYVTKNSLTSGGTITIVNDTVNLGFSDVGASSGTTGVTFSAQLSGGNIQLQYTSTSTGGTGTMKYTVRRW